MGIRAIDTSDAIEVHLLNSLKGSDNSINLKHIMQLNNKEKIHLPYTCEPCGGQKFMF